MTDLVGSLPPRGTAQPPALLYPDGSTPPWRGDDTKIRGLRLVLAWSAALLGSWGTVGLLAYGGYRLVAVVLP
jgi:hypothetical protein